MKPAYDEMYLYDAMRNLGEAFDYAAYTCGVELDDFLNIFITCGIADQFAHGVPKYVCGMSGTELTCDVLVRSGVKEVLFESTAVYDRSPEYWCGWILAYYQWYTGCSFKTIRQYISMEEVLRLYPTLHEAPEEKFVDVLNARIARQNSPTRLQVLRRAAYYSQAALAKEAGVGLRMIQQYEQRVRDINQASAANLAALSRTLGCRIEDLMETLQ